MTAITATARPGVRGRVVARWVLRTVLAAVFLMGGSSKVAGAPEAVELFDDIGAGQGLRYLVGSLEVAGAVGLFVPRLARAAALGLAALMVGATVTNLAVLQVSPALPVVLGLTAGCAAVLSRPASRRRSAAARRHSR